MNHVFMSKYFKCSLVFIVFILLIACSRKVRLSEANGISKSLSFSVRFTDRILNDKSYEEQAKKIGLTDASLYRFVYYPKSYLELLEEGNIVPFFNYSNYIRFFGIDTLQNLRSDFANSQIIFLLGRNVSGNLTVVADRNRNNSFLDDSVYIIKPVFPYKAPTIDDLELLPAVRFDNIEEYYKNSKHKSSLTIVPFPFVERNSIGNPDSTFHLRIISGQYFTGTFKYKGKKYTVAVRNSMLPFINYNPRFFDIKFTPDIDDPLFPKYDRLKYHLGDSIKLDNASFIIKSISPFLKDISFKKIK